MSNGLKDMAELIALLVADLQADNEAAEEKLKLEHFRALLDKMDPRGPVWGLVDPRIDSKWDTDE